MRNHIARLVKCMALLGLWSIVIASTSPLRAEPDTNKTKQRLSRSLANLSRTIDEIKWANVTIYRVTDDLRTRLIEPQMAASAKDSARIGDIGQTINLVGDPLPDFYNRVMRIPSRRLRALPEFRQAIADAYAEFNLTIDDIDEQEAEQALALVNKVLTTRRNIPKDYFLITTRDKNNPLLIALVGIEDNPAGGFNLKGNPQAGLDLYENLQAMDATLYDDLRSAVSLNDDRLKNQMFVLRDLSEIALAEPTRTRATYLDEDQFEHVLLSVSQGRPLRPQDSNRIFNLDPSAVDPTLPKPESGTPNTVEFPYEITVGTDVVAAFVAYKVNQDTLPLPVPDWGVELRNNFDEINYPSIWGGRLTLNAILENIKIGAVLPQIRFGGNTIDSSGIGTSRQKILGGYGLAVSGDFAAPVLNNSGLFNFYGSYTFSEANTDRVRLFDSTPGAVNEQGYLIRYAVQAYYSFGFYVDAAARHLLRIKVGGTAYGVDGFTRHNEPNNLGGEPTSTLVKGSTETFGGISGKIEYMKVGQAIPWGASVQYVDNSILGDIWIQFAITPRIDLKFEGKYFTPLDKKDRAITHPWENPNLIVPAITAKYHF